MKKLFTDDEARKTVAAMYLPGIKKCVDTLKQLHDEFQSVVAGGYTPSILGRPKEGLHWTQKPENKARLKKLAEARAKKRGRPAVAVTPLEAKVLAVVKAAAGPLTTGALANEAGVKNQHSILSRMREKGLLKQPGHGLWEAA